MKLSNEKQYLNFFDVIKKHYQMLPGDNVSQTTTMIFVAWKLNKIDARMSDKKYIFIYNYAMW